MFSTTERIAIPVAANFFHQFFQHFMKFSAVPFILLTSLGGSPLFAGAWTLSQGELRVKTSYFLQNTRERYASRVLFCGNRRCNNGERIPFFFDGEVESNALYFDAWFGLTDRIELQFQLPYFDIAFRDDVNPERPSTENVGDIRFGVRYRIPFEPIVTTIRVGAKAPTGFFNRDAEVVPVGDGQWDLELKADFGRSFWPAPLYANANIGYRIRFEPDTETSNLAPGNELTFGAEIGYSPLNNLLLKGGLSGFSGKAFVALFPESELRLQDSERRIIYATSGLIWNIRESLAFELSVRISLAGKNYPAGQIYGTGLSYTF